MDNTAHSTNMPLAALKWELCIIARIIVNKSQVLILRSPVYSYKIL